MHHNTVEVTPFKYTYRAYNKATGEQFDDFACLIEAIRFINARVVRVDYQQPAISFTLKREGPYRYITSHTRIWNEGDKYSSPRYAYGYADATPWVILDDLGVTGREVVEAAKHEHRSPWRHGIGDRDRRYDLLGTRLTRIKGSSDKVKASCEQVRCNWRFGGYTNLVRGYFRGVNTTHETRWNEAHKNEYGPGLVRAARNKRNLPNSWDDVYCGMYKTEDNWKHHSKRRKQWKPK